MRDLLRSELRKLLTVRSTYVTAIIAALFVGFMSFYTGGFNNGTAAANPYAFNELVVNIAHTVAFIAAIVGVLFAVHEYRYNIIMHTLTFSNNRTKIFLAKLLVLTGYAVAFSLLSVGLGLLMYVIGAAFGNFSLARQSFEPLVAIGRVTFFVFGNVILGYMLGILTRNLAAAIVLLLVGLNVVEGLLVLILKEDAIYLPLNALSQVIAGDTGLLFGKVLSPLNAAMLFSVYLVLAGAATLFLFQTRDAN